MTKTKFIVQTIDGVIASGKLHEIKDKLDADYSHLVGIAISDVHCSAHAILNLVKIKGIDLLPEDFEVAHILTSNNVEPNSRFYTLFEAVEISGDDILVRFTDPKYSTDYNLQIHLLLTNNPESINRAVLS